MKSSASQLANFLKYYYEGYPRLRLWSLVVTLFGDAIEPRGGVFRLGEMQKITDHIGIENNALRTAMSRLASDGWLNRQRIGRASFYRSSPRASLQNARASEIIYNFCPSGWEGKWLFAIATNPDGFDQNARQSLHEMSFAFAGKNLAIAPDVGDKTQPCGMKEVTCFIASQVRGANIEDLLPVIEFHVDCDGAYRQFLDMCDYVTALFPDPQNLDGLDAMVLRLILIHTWRRIVLKDVHWPRILRDDNWPGFKARCAFGRLYHQLLPPSEQWLSSLNSTPTGCLPPSQIDMTERFL